MSCGRRAPSEVFAPPKMAVKSPCCRWSGGGKETPRAGTYLPVWRMRVLATRRDFRYHCCIFVIYDMYELESGNHEE